MKIRTLGVSLAVAAAVLAAPQAQAFTATYNNDGTCTMVASQQEFEKMNSLAEKAGLTWVIQETNQPSVLSKTEVDWLIAELKRSIPQLDFDRKAWLNDLRNSGASQEEINAFDEAYRFHAQMAEESLKGAKACKAGKDYNETASGGNKVARVAGIAIGAGILAAIAV